MPWWRHCLQEWEATPRETSREHAQCSALSIWEKCGYEEDYIPAAGTHYPPKGLRGFQLPESGGVEFASSILIEPVSLNANLRRVGIRAEFFEFLRTFR